MTNLKVSTAAGVAKMHKPDTCQELTLLITINLRYQESKCALFSSWKIQSTNNLIIMISAFFLKSVSNSDMLYGFLIAENVNLFIPTTFQ